MQTIELSTLVGSNIAELFTAEEQELKQIQATPKRTRRAIPESVKGYTHPTDINAFIRDILPNMVEYASSKLIDKDQVYETINDFVIYMLSPAPSRDNKPHWLLYDPVAYSKQPYYKWFLINLRFYCQSANRNLAKRAQMVSLVETYEEVEAAPGAVTLDMVSQLDPSDDPISMLIVKDVAEFLEAHSKQFEGKRCFDAYAYQMFLALMNGATKKELADYLQISTSATGQWIEQLRKLVRTVLDTGTGPRLAPAV